MSELRLRIAKSADVSLLLGMMEPFNALEGIPWNEPAKERALRALLAGPELGLVAVLDGSEGALGYFVLTWGYDLEWDGRDAFLTELFLIPTARGSGNGSRALRAIERLAREHGARALHLMVQHENTVARRLYTSHGYTSPPRLFLSKALE
ncbi:MAG TPA: GNAT family N-acetyltransferase [Polyangiaceae bacterium]|nr:GNAT family N-acetyltransferase [Polyangiaceae bacterium]